LTPPSCGRRALVAALMLVAMALWTGVELLGGVAGRGYSPIQLVWTRYAVHIVVLVVLTLPRGVDRLRTPRPRLQFLRSSMMIGMPVFFVLARRVQGSRDTWAIFWLSPLLAMALGAIFMGEKVAFRTAWAALAGLTGMWLVLSPPLRATAQGGCLSIVMCVCFALYLIMTRMLKGEPTESKLLFTALGVFLGLTPVLPFVWRTPSVATLAMMAAVGIVGLGGLYAIDKALESAPLPVVAPLAYTQAFWLMLTDEPAPLAITGSLLTLVAGWYALVAGDRRVEGEPLTIPGRSPSDAT